MLRLFSEQHGPLRPSHRRRRGRAASDPDLGRPLRGLAAGVVMFGMGMTLTFQDFKRVLQRPWEVLLGVVAQFLIMPLAAWFLVWLFACRRNWLSASS